VNPKDKYWFKCNKSLAFSRQYMTFNSRSINSKIVLFFEF